MASNQASSEKFWPRGISWLTVVFAVLAIVSFIFIANSETRYALPIGITGGGMGLQSLSGSANMEKRVSDVRNSGNVNYQYPPNQEVPVSDTREFLKVYYNAVMRTRDVQGLTRRVETKVRGYQGRVDQVSESPQYGFVSFVVPQSKYDAFRTELEGLVSSRFLTTNISSQNLLSEKQSIEEQQKQADASLSDYMTARQNIVNTHTNTVQSLQSRIDADVRTLASLRAQNETPEILAQIQNVSNDLTSLKRQLTNENASYSVKLTNADNNVKHAQDLQKAVQTQDQALLDNVATVRGTVAIQWINLWEIIRLYLPGYWISIIFATLATLSFLYDRWRFNRR